jgi:Asp-tRNA(Asn)/Glu-tRNA(Gln) amidotransferase A subunit family amidase
MGVDLPLEPGHHMELTSAAVIAERVRSGRVTATEVVSASVESAIESHDDLHAFTLIDRSGALTRAAGIDRLVAEGKDPGPLAGVPVSLKDLIDQAGLPNTHGSSFPAPLSENSATVVRRLGAAGAVIIGRTGLHEFAFGFTSENPWFGPVKNPWDTDTSPGGSSGGSAVAVAAGITPIGIGTDTGGSVRVPAALCGVFGLKVTHGRIPLTGVYPLVASLDTVGPIAGSIDDLTLAYVAMAGSDAADGWSAVRDVQAPSPAGVERPFTIGVVRQWLSAGPMTSQTRSAIDQFIDRAAEAGALIEDVDNPSLAPPRSLGSATGPEILSVHADRFAQHRNRYGDDLQERLDICKEGTASDLVEAVAWGAGARNTVDRMSRDGVDILLAPTVGHNVKTIGVPDMHTADGAFFHRQYLASFTSPINRIGLPALAVPIARDEGLPYSAQLIAPMWHEHRLLEIGKRLERDGLARSGRPPLWYGQGGNGRDGVPTQ